MKRIFLFTLAMCFVCLFSCEEYTRNQEVKKIIRTWMNKQVQIPDNYQCNISGKDTTPSTCVEILQRPYKVLLYADSAGCLDCKFKAFAWKQLIHEADSLFPNQVGFLFFIQPRNKKELQHILKWNRMNYAVFIDEDNIINQHNHFPVQLPYQCFLLDRKNTVVGIGNPTFNSKIWELYKKQIGGERIK
jgi:hypothetical protein